MNYISDRYAFSTIRSTSSLSFRFLSYADSDSLSHRTPSRGSDEAFNDAKVPYGRYQNCQFPPWRLLLFFQSFCRLVDIVGVVEIMNRKMITVLKKLGLVIGNGK